MNTGKLSKQAQKVKDNLEADLNETRDVVKQLKDFLTGNAPLSEVSWMDGYMEGAFTGF